MAFYKIKQDLFWFKKKVEMFFFEGCILNFFFFLIRLPFLTDESQAGLVSKILHTSIGIRVEMASEVELVVVQASIVSSKMGVPLRNGDGAWLTCV